MIAEARSRLGDFCIVGKAYLWLSKLSRIGAGILFIPGNATNLGPGWMGWQSMGAATRSYLHLVQESQCRVRWRPVRG